MAIEQSGAGKLDEIVSLKRWTSGQARMVLGAAAKSRSSLVAFARRHGVDVRRLYWWSRQRPRASKPVSFKEVAFGNRPALHMGVCSMGFELVLRSGLVVRVGAEFDAG